MLLWDHLAELRIRVFKATIALGIGAVIGLIFCKKLFHILQIPMLKALPQGSFFIATNPFESYATYFKIALVAGVFISSPALFYQIWQFIAPALKPQEKKLVLPFSLASAFLFTIGALFGYFVVFPAGFAYVNIFLEGTHITLLPKMSDYFTVAFMLLLAFGISFELPLFIFLLGKMGIITYDSIKKGRRIAVVFFFFLAAILTPGPDVLSQALLAIPLWALYELGGVSLRLLPKP